MDISVQDNGKRLDRSSALAEKANKSVLLISDWAAFAGLGPPAKPILGERAIGLEASWMLVSRRGTFQGIWMIYSGVIGLAPNRGS
ncbi:hypothetical protein V5738_00690 [Salinisphaera sp. SPP-AMP-43]|uniref:hypothetical protein n=1 Tax=Salinisphaera sp. SPP-AMP-43 TaxID=3121288 RepID=UPI003C6E7B59